MDINKIFSLFESSSHDDLGIDALDQYDLKARIEFFGKYREHPAVWLGMFHKLISNYNTITSNILTITSFEPLLNPRYCVIILILAIFAI